MSESLSYVAETNFTPISTTDLSSSSISYLGIDVLGSMLIKSHLFPHSQNNFYTLRIMLSFKRLYSYNI